MQIIFQSDRNDYVLWDRLFEKAVSLAEAIGVDPCAPRRHGRQANRPNAHADTPSQYWKVNMFLSFLDHLVVELNKLYFSSFCVLLKLNHSEDTCPDKALSHSLYRWTPRPIRAPNSRCRVPESAEVCRMI